MGRPTPDQQSYAAKAWAEKRAAAVKKAEALREQRKATAAPQPQKQRRRWPRRRPDFVAPAESETHSRTGQSSVRSAGGAAARAPRGTSHATGAGAHAPDGVPSSAAFGVRCAQWPSERPSRRLRCRVTEPAAAATCGGRGAAVRRLRADGKPLPYRPSPTGGGAGEPLSSRSRRTPPRALPRAPWTQLRRL